MMSEQGSGFASVEHEGIKIESSSETPEQLRSVLNPTEAEPEEKPSEVRMADDSGKQRDGSGRFTGTVKPIKDAKPTEEEKPEKQAEAKPEKAERAAKDEAPDAEEVAAAKAEEKEKAEQRKRDAAAKVAEATQRATRERKDREAVEAENARLRDVLISKLTRQETAEAKTAPAREATGRPDPEKFSTMAEYLDARDAWNRAEALKEFESRQEAERQKAHAAEVEKRIHSAVAEFQAAVEAEGEMDDVDPELLSLEPSFMAQARGERLGPLNALADEIIRAGKNAPAMLRYLSANKGVLQRLSTLAPAAFAREMGRIEAKLEAATAASPAQPPSYKPEAFKPVRAVTGKPHAADSDEDEMSMDLDTLAAKRSRQGKFHALR